MGHENVLIEFLKSTLPAVLVTKALTFAPVVVAVIGLIMQWFSWAEARKRWLAPLLAAVLGMAAGFLAVGMDTSQLMLAAAVGLLIALTAIGGYSTGKNVTQAAKMSLALHSEKKIAAAALVSASIPKVPMGTPVLYRLLNGEQRPALVVRSWSPGCANLVVFLDGSNDTDQWPNGLPARTLERWWDQKGESHDSTAAPLVVWATSAVQGDKPGQWNYPELSAAS
ncbi:MAG TPA: hypothetical protein VD969_19485 [Symbiobacteriaceae bacterium]|nr:hypothetical protein [Symbiobacteriaceae bacterium]